MQIRIWVLAHNQFFYVKIYRGGGSGTEKLFEGWDVPAFCSPALCTVDADLMIPALPICNTEELVISLTRTVLITIL
jgi:hypothetical protein